MGAKPPFGALPGRLPDARRRFVADDVSASKHRHVFRLMTGRFGRRQRGESTQAVRSQPPRAWAGGDGGVARPARSYPRLLEKASHR